MGGTKERETNKEKGLGKTWFEYKVKKMMYK